MEKRRVVVGRSVGQDIGKPIIRFYREALLSTQHYYINTHGYTYAEICSNVGASDLPGLLMLSQSLSLSLNIIILSISISSVRFCRKGASMGSVARRPRGKVRLRFGWFNLDSAGSEGT